MVDLLSPRLTPLPSRQRLEEKVVSDHVNYTLTVCAPEPERRIGLLAFNDPSNLTDPDGEFIPLLILAAVGLWLADTEYANAPSVSDEIYRGTDFGPPQALAMIPDAIGVAASAMALTKGITATSILKAAAAGKGNFGLGSACAKAADALGNAWVGPGARLASDGKTLVSKNGLRQYRPPSSKPNSPYAPTGKQANFESRDIPSGPWQNNGHLDITH